MNDYNTIIETINNNVLQAIHNSLKPLWIKFEQEQSNYQTIVDIMRNMPEFKSIQLENENLKRLLKEKEQQISTPVEAVHESINLEVTEHDSSKSDISNIDDKVKLIYLDVKLVPKENSIQNISNVLEEDEETVDEVSEVEVSEIEVSEIEVDEEVSEVDEEVSEVEEASETVDEIEESEEASETVDEEEVCETVEEEEACETVDEEEEDIPTCERSANLQIQNDNVKEEEEEATEEFFMVEIEDFGNVYTNDENNGLMYEVTGDDDIGNQIGYFKDGEPILL